MSLQASDLVNEAVLRLLEVNNIDWQNRAHFLALAATTMRRILVDHARKKNANKREHYAVTLVTELTKDVNQSFDTLAVHDALERFKEIDEERANIVELRFFGGLSVNEIALCMNISPSTVKRSWRSSRAWLLSDLKGDDHQ